MSKNQEKCPRGRPRKQQRVVALHFKFASIEQIMEWCLVSRSTAYKYKYGEVKPSRRALTLFLLHYNGKVLGREWDGFLVKGDKLWSPENLPLSTGEIRAYQYIVQLAFSLRKTNQEVQSALERLLAARR